MGAKLLADFYDFVLVVPCGPPPSIANGHYTEADNYVYQTTVTYSCNNVQKGEDPFSLIGSPSIFCTVDENSNGFWSGPPPQCKGCFSNINISYRTQISISASFGTGELRGWMVFPTEEEELFCWCKLIKLQCTSDQLHYGY